MRGKVVVLVVLAGGAVAAVLLVRRFFSSPYDSEEIDSAQGDGAFGNRGAGTPEQSQSPAQTRSDRTPEQMSMAARIETSEPAIRAAWPAITSGEIRSAETDIALLARLIAEKTEQPQHQVRARLDDILAQETPRPSYPAL